MFTHEARKVLDAEHRLKRAEVREAERLRLAPAASRVAAPGASHRTQTVRVTPAMEAGLAEHVWSLEELVHLLLDSDPKTA